MRPHWSAAATEATDVLQLFADTREGAAGPRASNKHLQEDAAARASPGMMRSAVMYLAAAILVHSQASHCPPYNTLNNIVYLAHQHDCSMFRRCDAGQEILGQCPSDKHFSSSTSTCEDPARARCTAKPKSCTAGQPQEKCHYSCSCSIAQAINTCPTNIEFPTELGVFFWVDTSTCTIGSRDIFMGHKQVGRVSTESAFAKAGLCPKGLMPGRDYDYRHYADCSKMVRCKGTTEMVTDCPTGLVYDTSMGFCDDPAFVDCISNPAPPGGCPTTRPLSSCPYTCECSVSLGKCPAQLRYDAIINIVDSRTHPDCLADPSLIALDGRFYGSLEVKTRSAKFNKCPRGNQPSIQYVPDLLHCGVVSKCYGGRGRPVTCPTGSQFDTRTNTCVHNLVACKDPARPTVTPQSLPPVCPTSVTCTAGATKVRHPTDCTLFCECVQGAPYLGACPPGLHFSELTLTCELPGTANCQTWCSKLPVVEGGQWDPPQCADADSLEGTECNIRCDADRQLMGSAEITCTSSGWSGSFGLNLVPSCNTVAQVATSMVNTIQQTLTSIAEVDQKATMLFVLDESGSVEAHNFEIEKGFVEALVTAFPLSQERSAGVITFSDPGQATVDISLRQTSTCDFISQLHDINYENGNTDLSGALVLAKDEIDLSISGGVKPFTTLVFAITDGQSQSDPAGAAQQLRDNGHIVFTIGVASYDRAQLEPLSSNHARSGAKLFFGLPNFEVFQTVADYLKTTYNAGAKLSCNESLNIENISPE